MVLASADPLVLQGVCSCCFQSLSTGHLFLVPQDFNWGGYHRLLCLQTANLRRSALTVSTRRQCEVRADFRRGRSPPLTTAWALLGILSYQPELLAGMESSPQPEYGL